MLNAIKAQFSAREPFKKLLLSIALSYLSGLIICEMCLTFPTALGYVFGSKPDTGFKLIENLTFWLPYSLIFGGALAVLVGPFTYFLFFRKHPVIECFKTVFPITLISGMVGCFLPIDGNFVLTSWIGLFIGYYFYLRKIRFNTKDNKFPQI